MMPFRCSMLSAWMMEFDRIPYVRKFAQGICYGQKTETKTKTKSQKYFVDYGSSSTDCAHWFYIYFGCFDCKEFKRAL